MEINKRRTLSKFISKILRYKPEDFGVKFSEKGYCKLEDLIEAVIKHCEYKVTEEEICYILLTSKWKDEVHRFDVWKGYVRASYVPNKKVV